MQDALNEGTSLRGAFDDEMGYPTRVLIGDRVDLTTRDFIPVDRPEGCAAQPGSATDLASEPASWLLYGDYLRWSDAGGCEVRVDVISQIMAPEQCGWESATFVTIGTPIGAPHSTPEAPADGARTYIWDPEDVVAYIDGTQRDVSVPVEGLPAGVTDTGFRDGVAELWLDSADPTVLFRVGGGVADRFVLDEPRQILCE